MKQKRIFIAATRQNDGKTTVSLGLICALKKRFKRIGFIKPIGQRYLIEQGYKVDEDSVLIESICGIKCNLKDMSPVAIEKGFTERYIQKGSIAPLLKQIKNSFDKVSKNADLVIIEGTGHAGVGSCFDLSNAYVAKFLESKVLLVSEGGVGRPIDEIMLNKALFDKEGVELIGVVVNKVLSEKFQKINKFVRLGLKRKGLNVVGVMPYIKTLGLPTIKQVASEIDAEVLCGEDALDNRVAKILVGAMEPHDALNYIQDKSLVITPGDREDLILAVACQHSACYRDGLSVAGIVLTGGIIPHKNVMTLIKKHQIPILSVKGDTYSVASRIHDLTVKILPQDRQKIDTVTNLVKHYVDINKILKAI